MDFNYFSDTLDAFLRTAENVDAHGKVLTWGTGINTSIEELTKMIFSLIGRKKLHIVSDEERKRPYPGPMPSLKQDILATHRLLNYSPKIGLREGLQKTIEWISNHIDQYKTDKYVV